MKIVKKINTSAVLCVDNNGRQLVAFGRGLGFGDVWDEVDLDRVQRTFYSVDARYVALINELPDDVLEFCAQFVDVAIGLLDYELSPNMAFILADHIDFAIKRARDGIAVSMPLTYDIAQQYPMEYKLAKLIVERANRQFKVRMPKQEVAGVAMSFINNAVSTAASPAHTDEERFEAILEQTVNVIECAMGLSIDREGFNYARYATHLQYLYTRLVSGERIESENASMYAQMREDYPAVASCVDSINNIFLSEVGEGLTEEEQLYLMMHVNRMVSKAQVT